MKRLLLFLALLVFPVTAGAQLSTSVERGLNKIIDPAGRAPYIPEYIVATLPAKPSRRSLLAVVTDGSSASDCTVGGGATRVICIWNGSAFVTTSAATAPGGSNTQVQFNDSGSFGGNSAFTFNKTAKAATINSTVGTGNNLAAILITNVQAGTGNNYTSIDSSSTITEDNAESGSQVYGGYFTATTLGTNVNTGITAIGISSVAKSSGSSNFTASNALTGFLGTANHTSTGTLHTEYGGYFQAGNFASGVITNAYGLVADTTAASINKYGIGITNVSGGTTLSVALKIDNQGTGATDYAIKTGTGQNLLGDKLAVTGHVEYSGTAPAVSNTSANSCGTTAATLAGRDGAGKVTVGATSGTSCTVTFNQTWTNAPSCVVTNETTANLSRATSTTSTVILAGTFVGGDVLAYSCIGWK